MNITTRPQLCAKLPPDHVAWLHTPTRRHLNPCRDIKSSNILLDASGRAKVADVGLACQLRTVDRGVNAAGTFVSGRASLTHGRLVLPNSCAPLHVLLRWAGVPAGHPWMGL